MTAPHTHAGQATKPVPCLICGKELEPVQASGTQPLGAITFHGSGQYGSSWDPMNWEVALQVNVCDPCLYKNASRVLHVRTETQVRRDVRPWNPEEDEAPPSTPVIKLDDGTLFDTVVREYECSSTACPTQYEGNLTDGRTWYFRYRHGIASLGIGDNEFEAVNDSTDHELRHGEGLDGTLDLDEVKALWGKLYTQREGQ